MAVKLYSSANGDLLGIVHIPNGWEEDFRREGLTRIALYPEIRFPFQETVDPNTLVDIQVATFAGYRDGARLYGTTIEELERQKGVLFYPSVSYIRSLIKGEMK